MSNTKNTGGPAFPGNGEQFVEGVHGIQPQSAYGMQGSEGMTLRDYFAAKAMQALTQSEQFLREASEWRKIDGEDVEDAIAGSAYDLADAMLIAREQ